MTREEREAVYIHVLAAYGKRTGLLMPFDWWSGVKEALASLLGEDCREHEYQYYNAWLRSGEVDDGAA